MNAPTHEHESESAPSKGPKHLGAWIGLGLALGVLCGLLFGEYCWPMQLLGEAYVGLLQMTVLPYLVLALISKMGRLDGQRAGRLGVIALGVLLAFWALGVVLIVAVSAILPPMQGASFFSPSTTSPNGEETDVLLTLIPTNVFRSLASEYVPAVVMFCLFFGVALMAVPGKERLLDLLDMCTEGISRINTLLVRLAPVGLFLLTAAAAGTMRLDEFARLQAYLIILSVACGATSMVALPMLVSSLTDIRYGSVLRSAQEPVLTALATGKLFVVLPQIVEKCDELTGEGSEAALSGESIASVVAPLAYSFPHLGKVFTLVFISFAAWYVGEPLTWGETTSMAAEGTVSSFASPLVTIPFLLDAYQLPQDLLALFILPGFITMRIADMVGVVHLMALTLIVTCALRGQLRVYWARLLRSLVIVGLCLVVLGGVARWYLSSVGLEYDLDERLMSLTVPSPHDDVIVYRSQESVPERVLSEGSTLERIRADKVIRVGYHADHLPYTFFNQQQELVGFDIELMNRLAERLDTSLEFVPYEYNSVVAQLDAGEIDLAIGGLIITPERLIHVGFTQPYETATLSVVALDHRREEFSSLEGVLQRTDLRLAVVQEDLASAARRRLPNTEIIVLDSYSSFFSDSENQLDGLIIPAEEGAAWTVLHPGYTVIVPIPVTRRPVGIAVRLGAAEWRNFLDRWLDFERLDGSLDRLKTYWVEGGGTKQHPPRWCVLRDVLHWIP